jgi:hypothetical protein
MVVGIIAAFYTVRIRSMAYSGKPLSLHPMKFKDAVAALLRVKPESKEKPAKRSKGVKSGNAPRKKRSR